jgi:hypothetical protein
MSDDTPSILGSRAQFQAAVTAMLADAAEAGVHEIWLVDADFADWPLGDRALIDTLTRWALRPQRRLEMLARHYDDVPRRQPRFAEWRRQFAHVLRCRAVDVDAGEVPTWLLAGPGRGLVVLDKVHWRGRLCRDAADCQAGRELVDGLALRATDAFPATTLGI